MIGFKSFMTEGIKSPIEYLDDEKSKFIITNPKAISWANVNRILRAKGYDLRGAKDTEDRLMNWKYIRTDENQGKAILSSILYGFKEVEEKSKGQKWETAVKRYFGITTDPKEAGYIFQDGSMLDLSARKEGEIGGRRNFDHRQIGMAPVLEKDSSFQGGSEGMYEFMWETGAIRLLFNGNELNFDTSHKLSVKQVNVLKRLVSGKYDLYASYKDKEGHIIHHWEFQPGKQYHISKIAEEIDKGKFE